MIACSAGLTPCFIRPRPGCFSMESREIRLSMKKDCARATPSPPTFHSLHGRVVPNAANGDNRSFPTGGGDGGLQLPHAAVCG